MLDAFLKFFAPSKGNSLLIVDPSEIEYCPVRQDSISPRTYVKQPVRTTFPPYRASFNEVFSNVHEQLCKR